MPLRFLVCAMLVLGAGCGESAGDDAGPADAGSPDALRLDGGPTDAGPPPRAVPADGWADAIAGSDVAASITSSGMTYTNVASDPMLAIGAPDGLEGAVALGDVGHFFVADLGEGEEAFDGPGTDLDVREIGLPSGIPEPYAVLVSNDPSGPFVAVGEGVGPGTFDLSGSGLTSVRYVRVEGTQTADEILDAPGSPTYPGAEIDAVGAFYPGALP